jgi:hypothetical protein
MGCPTLLKREVWMDMPQEHTSHTRQQSTMHQQMQLLTVLTLQPIPFPLSKSTAPATIKTQTNKEALQDEGTSGCC